MATCAINRFQTPLMPSSPFYVGEGMAEELPEVLKQYDPDRYFLVTSRRLMDLFGGELAAAMDRQGVRHEPVLVEEGEALKSWEGLQALSEDVVERGATKDSVLIALGGGTVGNLVGMAAALIYRGIRFVEVPTTVMAQTDSTLSNKQAINGRQGKNQFGMYHAPLFIWADARYPRSEPLRQRRAGVVEGIKNILISMDSLKPATGILGAWKDPQRTRELVEMLIASKLEILRRDPSERGYGVILEYGHTFGHAIESLSRGDLLHGEAVSIGMCLAAELSHRLGYMESELLRAHHQVLGEELGAPTRLPESIAPEALFERISADNKRSGKGVGYLLLRKCGEFVNESGDYMVRLPEPTVREFLREVATSGGEVPQRPS